MRNPFCPVTFLPERPDRFGELRTSTTCRTTHLRLDEMPPSPASGRYLGPATSAWEGLSICKKSSLKRSPED
jgi:hypothetical protein